ncbi:MAG: transposase [Gammaproteobacteria bacterium]|nr:transposase [Gammaproteobacteria bacterium]
MTDSLAGARTFRLLLQKPANQKFYDSPNGSPCKKAVNSLRQHTDDASDDQTGHTKSTTIVFRWQLAALVPKPRINLARFHGVFAPNSSLRAAQG